MDGEERERAELEAQIARAKALEGDKPVEMTGLEKKEGEKITLNLFNTTSSENAQPTDADTPNAGSSAPSPPPQSTDNTTSISFGTIGTAAAAPKSTSISINPLKRPAPVNVFKQAKSAKTDSDGASSVGGKKSTMSESERLMKEDQARRMNRGGYAGAGPRREGNGGRRFVLQ